MAGDWVKMRKSLLGDPRVVRIASALNADRFRTIGVLFSAWCLLDEQTIDGHLAGYTEKAFDEIVGVHGIAAAMQSVGWLEIGDDFVKAPMFCEHNGQTAKRRAQDSVRKMSARNADNSRTKTGTREEKRREDSNKKNIKKKTEEWIMPEGVNVEAWDAWMTIRKKARAVNSEYSWKIILSEADKAGLTISEVVDRCARGTGGKGWVGFEAKYLARDIADGVMPQKIMKLDVLKIGPDGKPI